MNDREIRRYKMFSRVREFGAENTASFLSSSYAMELFTTISSLVNELSSHAVAQGEGSAKVRQGSTMKSILRDELREDLLAISRTARAISVYRDDFEDKFRVPKRGNDQLLINAARIFASQAAPFVSEFVKLELPPDFLDELNETIKQFENAVNDKYHGLSVSVNATEAMDQTVDRGMDAVKQLDAIVKNKFINEAAKLAAWASAKHTEKAPRSTPVVETPEPAKS